MPMRLHPTASPDLYTARPALADRVAGALTRDGTEAGYLFSKDVSAGTLKGVTLWTRK